MRHLHAAALCAALLPLSLAAGCPAEVEPGGDDLPKGVDDGGAPLAGLEARIQGPAAWPVGAGIELDASGSDHAAGRALDFAWELTPPAGGDCDVALQGASAAIASFTPACEGSHQLTVTVTTLDGSERETASHTVEGVRVRLATESIVRARVSEAAEVHVALERGAIPDGVIILDASVEPQPPATEVPELAGEGSPFLVPMLEPHATYDLIVAAKVGDDVISEEDLQVSVTALNSSPELSNLRYDAFDTGESTVLTADVVDADGDELSCTAAVIEGNDEGLSVEPNDSSECAFSVSTPDRLEPWTVLVTASDGEGSTTGTIAVMANNVPPSIVSVETDKDLAQLSYSCDTEGCASEEVRLTITATDDIDDAAQLSYAATLASSAAPGVVLDATPLAGAPGVIDLRITRADAGPIAGEYALMVEVTELTTVQETPGSSAVQRDVTVLNSAPTLQGFVDSTVHHTWAEDTGYTATIPGVLDAVDPEGNALELDVRLVSCPTASLPSAGCAGADLTVVESAVDGGRSFVLTAASDLSLLVGSYSFELAATDPEGDTVSVQAQVEVLNREPVVVGAHTANHSYSSATERYAASVPGAVVDPDGDPLTVDLSVRCPGGSTADFGSACAGGSPVVTVSEDFDLSLETLPGATSNFIGGYELVGTVSDGVATVGGTGDVAGSFQVENRPPDSSGGISASSTLRCDHKTTGTTVTNDPACTFLVEIDASDPDGDPLRIHLGQASGGFSTGSVVNDYTTSGTARATFKMTTTWNDFVFSYTIVQTTIAVTVEDSFGSNAGYYTVRPRFRNRDPVWGNNSRMEARTYIPSSPNGLIEVVGSFGQSTKLLQFSGDPSVGGYAGASGTSPGTYMPFKLYLDVSDPDGDPLVTASSVICTNNQLPDLGGSPYTYEFRPFTPGQPISLRMRAASKDCGRSVQVSMPVVLADPHHLGHMGFKCSIAGISSRAWDQLVVHENSVPMPSTIVHDWQMESYADDFTCAP